MESRGKGYSIGFKITNSYGFRVKGFPRRDIGFLSIDELIFSSLLFYLFIDAYSNGYTPDEIVATRTRWNFSDIP